MMSRSVKVPEKSSTEMETPLIGIHVTQRRQQIQLYPVVWQGVLALQAHRANVMMHYVSGNLHIPMQILSAHLRDGEGMGNSPLKIGQRQEMAHKKHILRKLKNKEEHCILLALPCGKSIGDLQQSASNLEQGFISFFREHDSMGIIKASQQGQEHPAFIIHFFPPGEFVDHFLSRVHSNTLQIVHNTTPLVVVITAV